MKNEVEIQAYAKINLGLDVVGRLDNGYHLLRSVMQQIDLHDTVALKKQEPEKGITFTSNSGEIPLDDTNLAYKAAKLIMAQAGLHAGVEIQLEKRIPVAAGMAGGSTDGAAVLIGMNELFELGYPMEELKAMGVKLGADVPFCIQGGTALAEGIGEKLTVISTIPSMYFVIAKPPISVSTKYVYENLKLDELEHPDTDGILAALEQKDVAAMTKRLGNVLESVTVKKYPIIDALKNSMKEAGAIGALMSGSGPTVFGVFSSMEDVQKAEKVLKEQYPDVFVKAVQAR
ncbi:MAG: 4-(cytidine 5'-diphospho)-2-C-methyl-D-erythritol kinase [Lachnospiraceae bacterium]